MYTVVDFGHATFFPCVNLTADTSEAFTEDEGILGFSTCETQDLGDGVLLVGDHIASSGGAQSSNTPTSSDTPQSSDAPESSQNPQSSAPPASSNPPESSDTPQSSAPPASSNPPESSDVPQSSAAPASSNLLQSSAQPASSAPLASSNPPQSSAPPASSNPPQSSVPPASSNPSQSSNPAESSDPANSSNTPNSDNGSSATGSDAWYCVAYTKYSSANCSGTAVAYGATCMSFSEASSKSGTCENVSGDGYESIHWADDLNYVGWEVTGPHGSDFCGDYCNFEYGLSTCNSCDPPLPETLTATFSGLADAFDFANGAHELEWVSGCTWRKDVSASEWIDLSDAYGSGNWVLEVHACGGTGSIEWESGFGTPCSPYGSYGSYSHPDDTCWDAHCGDSPCEASDGATASVS